MYEISIVGFKVVEVYCKFDNTNNIGWTVFQQRFDQSLNFALPWVFYKEGFGVIGEHYNFWLGNDALHFLSSQNSYKLRVEVVDIDGDAVFSEVKSN